MVRYLSNRLVQMVIIYILFQTMIYWILQAAPGDFADQWVLNPKIPPETRVAMAARLGLDKPPIEQFYNYMKNFWTGNFGASWGYYPRPVMDIIAERAPRTLALFLASNIVSFLVGFNAGKLLAWNRGGFVEYSSTLFGVILYTVFTPWFGLMMIWFWGVMLPQWTNGLIGFPAGKFLDPDVWRSVHLDADAIFAQMLSVTTVLLLSIAALFFFTRKIIPILRQRARLIGLAVLFGAFFLYWATSGVGEFAGDIAYHMVLPVATVTLVNFAGQMLLTRNTMLETLREDYILTARAKGLSEKVVRDHHAARNAMLPVVTALVYTVAFAIGGGIITESIFSWPGLGLTLLQASGQGDIPLAVACLMILGALALVAHFVADLMYAVLDPRIRYQ